jgi:hypothetical protein
MEVYARPPRIIDVWVQTMVDPARRRAPKSQVSCYSGAAMHMYMNTSYLTHYNAF